MLDTTVFMAGRDRPYRFGLLKQGDHVVVRGGGAGKPAEDAQAAAPPGAGKAKNKQARAAGQGGMADGEPVARQVVVRPARREEGEDGQAASLARQHQRGKRCHSTMNAPAWRTCCVGPASARASRS